MEKHKRFILIDPSNRTCPDCQIDERLVLPEWAVIPLHAGTLTRLMAAHAENGGDHTLTPATDLGFHAVPSIVMLVDLLLLSPPWTISALPSLGLSGTIAFGYWFWVEQCFSYNGW